MSVKGGLISKDMIIDQFGPTYPQKQMCEITTIKLLNHFNLES